MWRLLQLALQALFGLSLAALASDCSEAFNDCTRLCSATGYCALSSCFQQCLGEHCPAFCAEIGCPPGNQLPDCLVPCEDEQSNEQHTGHYHTCSFATSLTIF